ncbi:MAG: B12-binding domain-containing radical SAM protein [SAR324 cluster bacterium]|uniref:B12-binding domain-containing radical SAM protein n=1 Tax=SAR324 cluster bacterium TaxID=2024889 RepID=A0A7X9FRC1_9DELT|nr:B12-binding domain-containing radical SAM protein [SAR324 cluster bacterium]
MPNALLVYPDFPPSYWSEKYALDFIGKKSAMPPLGLLTLASLFPKHYNLKLVDMNYTSLTDEMLSWSDYVFCSAMIVQRDSFKEVVARCNAMGVPIIAGGPYPTSFCDEISGVDHLVLGEVEDFFADFLKDLEANTAAKIYRPPIGENGEPRRPSVEHIAPPRYDLLNLNDYASVSLQFSRGCPFNCEFCDITKLYGRVSRTKTIQQVIKELDALYESGWRGTVFFVDDNFIGNREQANRLMPQIAAWQKKRNYPFAFYTEASVNLSEMPDLMTDMADAGFDMVFLGLETPNPDALKQANKGHNIRHGNPNYLLDAVRTIQSYGMEVTGGFILGLDGDDESSFDAQINFIQKAGIPTAMVGLLNALKGTDLYQRLKREGRLLSESSGNNVCSALNFIPRINPEMLLDGYRRVLSTLYDSSLRNYFARCYTLLKNWKQRKYCTRPIGMVEITAYLKTLWRQLFSRQGPAYLKFQLKVLLRRPRMFSEAIRLAVLGYHYEKVTRQQILVDEFKNFLDLQMGIFRERISYYEKMGSAHITELSSYFMEHFKDIRKRYEAINKDFRSTADDALLAFKASLNVQLQRFNQVCKLEVPEIF